MSVFDKHNHVTLCRNRIELQKLLTYVAEYQLLSITQGNGGYTVVWWSYDKDEDWMIRRVLR